MSVTVQIDGTSHELKVLVEHIDCISYEQKMLTISEARCCS